VHRSGEFVSRSWYVAGGAGLRGVTVSVRMPPDSAPEKVAGGGGSILTGPASIRNVPSTVNVPSDRRAGAANWPWPQPATKSHVRSATDRHAPLSPVHRPFDRLVGAAGVALHAQTSTHDALIVTLASVRMKCFQLLLPAALAAATPACGAPSARPPPLPDRCTSQPRSRRRRSPGPTFPGGCQILPYIRSGSTVIYPSGGGWACPAIIAMATLHPGESITSDVRVRAAASAAPPVVPLARGDYAASATVDTTEQHLASDSVAFTVR
jgi:hypothetical protein